MGPQRGILRAIRPRGPRLVFQYNPETVREFGGLAVYEDKVRPKRKRARNFTEVSPRRLEFALFLDAFPDGSVEDQIDILRTFARPRAPGKRGPELEFVYGPAGRRATWEMGEGDLEPGPELRNRNLRIVRQQFDIILHEVVDADVRVTPADRHRERSGGNRGGKTHRVVAGETLADVAVVHFGDASRWPDIAALNGIRDPRRLSLGATLTLPES